MGSNKTSGILTCPNCGNSLKEINQKFYCSNCRKDYFIKENTVFLSGEKSNLKKNLKRIIFAALKELNPIYHWPFSYLTKKKFEELYNGYLSDKKVAERFKRDYLSGDAGRKSGGVALDFGCSRGRISALMSQLGFKVVGLDKAYNSWWGNIKNSNFVVYEAEEKLPFKDGSFDIILAFLALEYIPKDKTIVREFNKKLKDGGYLIIQVPNKNHLRYLLTRRKLAPSHLREYSIEEIKNLLGANDFRVEKIWTEKFYSPIFTNTLNYVFEILLPHKILDFVSSITPQKYRGIINIIAQKQ